ncbi:MAG: DMT family transporter [Pseudomonadota bacterium]
MSNNSNTFALGVGATAFATIAWGIQMPVAHDAFAVIDPFHITALRYLVSSIVLVFLLAWREGWSALSYGGQLPKITGLGVIGMCGSPVIVFLGMSLSTAEHVVVIVSLQPAIAILAYWILRGVRPTNFTLVCVSIAFVGVVLVVTRASLSFADSPLQLLGDAMALIGSAFWVIYTIGIGQLSKFSTWRITVLTMVPGALATCTLTMVLVGLDILQPPSLQALGNLSLELGYLIFIGVLLAMLAWNYGRRHIGAVNATLFINCMPVAAFAYRAFQGYAFVWIELLGTGLVVGALVANNLHQRRLVNDPLSA